VTPKELTLVCNKLQVFLGQRLSEFESREDSSSSWLYEEQRRSAPPELQQGKETIDAYLKAVGAVISSLNRNKIRQLLDIKTSNKFLTLSLLLIV